MKTADLEVMARHMGDLLETTEYRREAMDLKEVTVNLMEDLLVTMHLLATMRTLKMLAAELTTMAVREAHIARADRGKKKWLTSHKSQSKCSFVQSM